MSYKTMRTAAAKFAKNCHADYSDTRSGIAGANYYHHPEDPEGSFRQYITNGYYGVSYSIPLNGLVEAVKESAIDYARMQFCSYSPEYQEDYKEVALPSLAELKEAWKKEKKRCVGNPENRNKCWRLASVGKDYERLSDYVVVDIEYLIDLMEITDCSGRETAYWRNAISPVFVHRFVETPDGETCIVDGILLPIRATPNKICLNDEKKPKITYLWGKTASDFVN